MSSLVSEHRIILMVLAKNDATVTSALTFSHRWSRCEFNVLILCFETTFGAEKHTTIKSDIPSGDVASVTASYCAWSHSASNILVWCALFLKLLKTKRKTNGTKYTLIHTPGIPKTSFKSGLIWII